MRVKWVPMAACEALNLGVNLVEVTTLFKTIRCN
jgi:hypothetical protein